MSCFRLALCTAYHTHRSLTCRLQSVLFTTFGVSPRKTLVEQQPTIIYFRVNISLSELDGLDLHSFTSSLNWKKSVVYLILIAALTL